MTDAKVKKGDFIEIEFTGYSNNEPFDSNIPEDLKKINPEAKPEKLVIILGEGMLVPGLDKQLENKELNKQYEIQVPYKEGFGARDRNLIRTLPLKQFQEQKIDPYPGMVLALDQSVVKIIAVSGARVTADFNNLLAGKDLTYKITIKKIVTENKEKAETLLKFFFRFVPDFEVKEKKVIVKLPKGLEQMVDNMKKKFKDVSDLDLEFEEKKIEKKPDEPKEKKN